MYVEHHLGDISWDTFVALATLALAFTTYVVARRTGQLAKDTKVLAETTASDVEAQFRPVVVPAQWSIPVAGHRQREIFHWVEGDIGDPRTFAITNVGKGPALKVRARGRVQDGAPQEARVFDRVVAVGGAPVIVEMVGPMQVLPSLGRIVDIEYQSANGDEWVSELLIEEGETNRFRISLRDVRRVPD